MSIYRTRICQWQLCTNHILLSALNFIGLAPQERCNFPSPLLLHLSLLIYFLPLANRDCRLSINLEDPVPIFDLQACISWRNKPRTLLPAPIPPPRHILPVNHIYTRDMKRNSPIKIINKSICSQNFLLGFPNCRKGKVRKWEVKVTVFWIKRHSLQMYGAEKVPTCAFLNSMQDEWSFWRPLIYTPRSARKSVPSTIYTVGCLGLSADPDAVAKRECFTAVENRTKTSSTYLSHVLTEVQ